MADVMAEMIDMVDKACKTAGAKRTLVFYSAYESDEDDEPINNLKEVAVTGKVKLVGYSDDYWGGKASKTYNSPVLSNPTWLEVCVYCNQMILVTNDHHHSFLEGLDKLGQDSTEDGTVTIYEFSMGS